MDTIERTAIPTEVGAPYGGGFYVARYMHAGVERALIRAPKAAGHFEAIWNKSRKDVPGAVSCFDGLANTIAMAEAGSKIAEQICALHIGGFDDWCIPAQDQLELCYRHLKPGKAGNYPYSRSGINVSALPPTYPYAAAAPAQTPVEIFQEGGAEAFELDWYWTSTQYAGAPDWAWIQYFDDGYQDDSRKDYRDRVCAVRSVIIR